MNKFDLLNQILEEGKEGDTTPASARMLLAEILWRAYAAGLREGLTVAEGGVSWLTRLPETREWLEKAIAKAKTEGGIA